MLRVFRQRRAIKKIVRRLPLVIYDLFGPKNSYSVEEVNRTVERDGMDKAFAAYAHALLCKQQDFESHYAPLKLRCTYLGLRRKLAKRFFCGIIDFDAQSVYRCALDYRRKYVSDQFYESGLGEPGTGSGDTHH